MTYTDEQLRDLRDAIDAHLAGKPVEYLLDDGGSEWIETTVPTFSPWKFRPKREPVTRLWNCPADVPMPICWVRNKDLSDSTLNALIVNVSHKGFEYFANECRFIMWEDSDKLKLLEYSTTCRRSDWHPLTVEDGSIRRLPMQPQDSPFSLPSEQQHHATNRLS